MKEQLNIQATAVIAELYEKAKLKAGDTVVIGCSTSEIAGGKIGKASVPEIGEWVAAAALRTCEAKGLIPIFQCCEHLNRALVMPLDAANALGYIRVHAIPQPKAGGSVPAAAWKLMEKPCLVIAVQADAGIDMGDTLIGMHLKPVAVPVRGEITKVGNAHVTAAYSRLPYIGGERAVYQEQ